MSANLIGKRYAEALAESIPNKKALKSALENLKAFSGAFKTEPRLSRFFAHPTISQEKKAAMVEDLCNRVKAEKEVRSMMLILAARKKILFVPKIAEYFERSVDARLNQVRVQVRSASELSRSNIKNLENSLDRILGKTILLETEVDESLLGGIQLRVGDQVADATIRNRLTRLKRTIEQEEVVQ